MVRKIIEVANLLRNFSFSSCADMYASRLATKTASVSNSSSISANAVNSSAEAMCRQYSTLSRTAVMYEYSMVTLEMAKENDEV